MLRRAFLVLSVLVLTMVGCVPRWTIRQQAVPNPLLGQRRFNLEGVHWEQLRVGEKSEAEYLGGKSPEQQQSFQSDKKMFEQRFVEALTSEARGVQFVPAPPGDGAAFTVRPLVTFFEPGFYVGVARRDSEAELTVQVFSPDGKLVDEIAIHSRIAATLTSPSSGDRMRKCGDDLGGVTASYLSKRVNPS
jgi:hypothetical protein